MLAPLVLLGALSLILIGVCLRPRLTLGVVLGTPLFFRFSAEGIDFGGSVFTPQEGITLPIAALAAPLFTGMISLEALSRDSITRRGWNGDRLVVLFIAWAAVTFVLSALGRQGPSPLILLQIVAPLLFYLVGRGVAAEGSRETIRGFVSASGVACVWLAISGIVLTPNPLGGNRLGDRLLGGLEVYQAYDYFPFLLVLAFGATIGLFISTKSWWYAYAAVCFGGVVLTLYSRTAIASLLAACVAIAYLNRQRIPRRAFAASVLTGIAILGATVALGVSAPNRLIATVDPTAARSDGSNRVRAAAVEEAAGYITESPVFGRAFTPTEVAPGTGVSKTINAHNQYLDYGVRAGVPLMAVFAAILFVTIRHAWRQVVARRWSAPYPELGALLLVAALISNFSQSAFVQPLSAAPLWLFVGVLTTPGRVGTGTAPRERRSLRERPVVAVRRGAVGHGGPRP